VFAPCVYNFADAPPKGSFYTAITWMACEGITAGYSDGSFGKTRQITRGEAAQFLYRMSGETHAPGTERDFTDVNPGGVGFTAISWMEAERMTAGYADGSFGTNQPISRGELASYMHRMGGGGPGAIKSPYADMKTTSAFYTAASWLKTTGLVGGYADGAFRPGKSIARGETAAFLYALETHLNGEPAAPTSTPKNFPFAPKPTPSGKIYAKMNMSLYEGTSYSSKRLKTIPAQTELVVLGKPSGQRVLVKHGSTTGYVNSTLTHKGKPGAAPTEFPRGTSYAHKAANHVSKWCTGVPVTTFSGNGGRAGYISSYFASAPDALIASEYIQITNTNPVDHPVTKAIMIHECAHILQYRAYGYDGFALQTAMDRVYPGGTSGGVEHMADCMADVMGAKRAGVDYIAGYRGTCSIAQLNAAKKIVAGQQV
jgi:hypothetical protein